MKTVLPREQAVEDIFSKILASPEASRRLREVFLPVIWMMNICWWMRIRTTFCRYSFTLIRTGDVSAFFWNCAEKVCLICSAKLSDPKKIPGKAGEGIRSFLPMWKGSFLKMLERWFPPMTMENLRKPLTGMNAYQDPDFIWQMDMTLYALTRWIGN